MLENLCQDQVTLIIVPDGVKPTAMPQAAKLKKQIDEGVFTGTRDTRKHERMKEFLESIWGPRGSVL